MATWSPKEDLIIPVRITVSICDRIKDEAGVDLLAKEKREAQKTQADLLDIHKFILVLSIICERHLEKMEITTKEQFMKLFDEEDAFPKAREAFSQAAADFFRECGRADLAAAWQKVGEITSAVITATVEDFEKIKTTEIVEKIRARMDINSEITRTLDQLPTIDN